MDCFQHPLKLEWISSMPQKLEAQKASLALQSGPFDPMSAAGAKPAMRLQKTSPMPSPKITDMICTKYQVHLAPSLASVSFTPILVHGFHLPANLGICSVLLQCCAVRLVNCQGTVSRWPCCSQQHSSLQDLGATAGPMMSSR